MSKLYACVTIDTEPDCSVTWRKKEPYTFTSVTHGMPDLLRPLFVKQGVHPVYFTAPSVASSPECCEILKQEIDLGSEIGNHLHGEEIESQDIHHKTFACNDYTDAEEYSRIKTLDEIIQKNLKVKPVSYRAGRYGCDINTIRSLERLAYQIDSSVTPGINWTSRGGPDFSAAPGQPYFIDSSGASICEQTSKGKILEVPVTVSGKRFPLLPDKWFLYRWLRPSFMFGFELKLLIDSLMRQYHENECVVLCILFHSVEVIPNASPYVRSVSAQRMFLKRLDNLLETLKQKGFEFRTLREIYSRYQKV